MMAARMSVADDEISSVSGLDKRGPRLNSIIELNRRARHRAWAGREAQIWRGSAAAFPC
jgi:hypothetical protein